MRILFSGSLISFLFLLVACGSTDVDGAYSAPVGLVQGQVQQAEGSAPVHRPPVLSDNGPMDDCRPYFQNPNDYNPEDVPETCLSFYDEWWRNAQYRPEPTQPEEVRIPMAPPVLRGPRLEELPVSTKNPPMPRGGMSPSFEDGIPEI